MCDYDVMWLKHHMILVLSSQGSTFFEEHRAQLLGGGGDVELWRSLGSNHVVLYLNIISAIDMLAPTNYACTNAVSLVCTCHQLPTALEHTITCPDTSQQHRKNEAQRWQWHPSTPSGGQAISDQQENRDKPLPIKIIRTA